MSNILNMAFIDDLKSVDEDGSNETLNDLIEMFKASSFERMKDLMKQFEEGELVAMRKVAHSLRSSSLNLGAVIYPEALLKIEYSTDEQKKDLPLMLQTVVEEYHKLLKALSDLK